MDSQPDASSLGDDVPPGADEHAAKVVYFGTVKERPTIELRQSGPDHNEAFLVPSGAAPIPTGVSLQESPSGYRVFCRIRQRWFKFKPEEVVRQMMLNRLIDSMGYLDTHIGVEVPIQMGSTVHDKPADIVVFTDTDHEQPWIVIEVKSRLGRTASSSLNHI